VPRLVPAELELAATAPPAAVEPAPFEVQTRVPGVLGSLELQEIQPRPPGPGEIQVAVRYVAMNFRDILRALGRQPAEASFELELGDECAGIVTAAGEGVRHVRVGDRVVGCAIGAFRSTVTYSAGTFLAVPPQMTMQNAVSMPVAFVTADYALRIIGRVQRGESVLIHSAAGGVGLAAVQVARHLGAEVFATVGSPAKRDLLRHLGVRHVFDSRSLDFADAVLEATEGRGVDVVLNSLAGPAMLASLSCVAPYGRFLELGKRDFHENTKVGLWPFRRNLSYFAVDLVPLVIHRMDELRQLLGDVFQHAADGQFFPLPQRPFSVDRVADAFRLMSQGTHIGKIVVDMAMNANRVRRTARGPTIHADATYLITGAFGGVGLTVAEWLADHGARHLVLISRGGAQSPLAHEMLAKLRARGVNVRDVRCDVADAEEMNLMMEAIRREMPRLAGVFHLAMVLDDGLLINLNRERFRRVTRPKVLGGWNLHWLTRDADLDYFVVFSSASGWFGNFGQASYAAANGALERLVEWRRSQGLPGTAIAWGMLTETGYIADRPELLQSLMQLGLLGLNRQDMRCLLDLFLGTNQCTVVTLPIDRQRFAQRFMKLKKSRGILSKLTEAASDSDAADGSITARETILSASAEDRPALIQEFLRGVAGRVLGISPTKLPGDRPLYDLGLDSLMALELSNLIESQLGVPVPMNEISRAVSIDRLGATLLAALQPESDPSRGPPSRSPLAGCLVKLADAANVRSLFCFHPAGGELSIYQNLAASLAGRCTVYGIQSPTVAGVAEEFVSLRDMCASYAAIIAESQPQGPYQLFGFSLGGMLAVGTARALEQTGRSVSLLAVAECDLRWSQPQEHQALVLSNLCAQLYAQLRRELTSLRDHPPDIVELEVRSLAETLISSTPGRGASAILNWAESAGYLPDDIPRDLAAAHFARIETHLRLLMTNEGQGRVAAPLYLWTATDGLVQDERHWAAVTDQPAGTWTIAGGHFEILMGPHAQVVADQLESLMSPHGSAAPGV
jgi:NADPH:quinone reductase-like Zn-dependent oxidoreductase/thioesterase domain-containing protein/acyl carrier protein